MLVQFNFKSIMWCGGVQKLEYIIIIGFFGITQFMENFKMSRKKDKMSRIWLKCNFVNILEMF